MKKLFLIVVLVSFLANCAGDDLNQENEIAVPVSVEEIKLKSIEEFLDATGTALSTKEAQLRSEITGYYKLLVNRSTGKTFKIGDFVKEGQQIISIDDPEYRNNIRIDLKKLQLEQSKSEYEKQKSLFDKGGVTLTQLKTAELNNINEEYSYENAVIQLEKMNVKAPFSGVIVDISYYTPGVKISQNSPLLKIMDYKKLYLEVNLPEKNLDFIKSNQPARIMNYSLPDDTLKGFVTQKSPAIDSGTRTFKASLSIENPDLKLRPGMFVKAEIIIDKKDDVIVIPKDIILAQERGKTVYVVEKGASDRRIITTGLENPTEVEVTTGLKENERIVTRGFETLRNRQKVKIIK